MNMNYTKEVEEMCSVKVGASHGCAPIPQEGKWTYSREIKDINGFTHGIGWCAPQQGACKLTLNVKNGIIEEALIETVGCSFRHRTGCCCLGYGKLFVGENSYQRQKTGIDPCADSLPAAPCYTSESHLSDNEQYRAA